MTKQTESNRKLLDRIQASSRKVRGEAGTGHDTLLFLNTQYETFPVILQQETLISSNAKTVYNNLWIWAKSAKQTSLQASLFPGYDYIMRATGLSRGTVGSSLAQLRLQRYLTLHQKIRNDQGMFVGNDYILNDEPMGLSDTLALDNDYVEFVEECKTYRHQRVQHLANLMSASIKEHIESEDNPFRPATHMEKIEARQQAAQIIQTRLFPEDTNPEQPEPQHYFGIPIKEYNAIINQVHKVNSDESDEIDQVHKVNSVVNSGKNPKTSQVHNVNAGETLTEVQVHNVNAEVNLEVNSCSSGFINNTTTTVEGEFTELVYPSFETPNELHICKLLMAKVKPEYQQAILDELSARMSSSSKHHQKLDNPIGYLKGWLIKKLDEGELPLTSLGAKLAAKRANSHNEPTVDVKEIQGQVAALVQDIRHLDMMIEFQTKLGQEPYDLIEQRDVKQAEIAELETRRAG